MDKPRVPVLIRWLTPEQGGRKSPPFAGYMPRIEFEYFPFAQGEAWSVVLDDLRTNGTESEGSMRFLSEEAPVEALQRGGAFKLFEGGRTVAEGYVLALVPSHA